MPFTDSPKLIKKYFSFLEEEYDCRIIRETTSNMGLAIYYQNNHSRIEITYDYRDTGLGVVLYKGKDTSYVDTVELRAANIDTIIPMKDLILKHNPHFDVSTLEPQRDPSSKRPIMYSTTHYREAIQQNAEILKRYGKDILMGKEAS